MEHFFKNIEGWCDFYDLYADMVKKHADGAHFVEVGSWKGHSASFMAVEIANSGKNIRLDVVDIMTEEAPPVFRKDRVALFLERHEEIKRNLSPVPWVNIIPKSSEAAASMYSDGMLDFVYVDADHHYENVCKDIMAWIPKLKKGGIMAGHDYHNYEGVRRAVNQLLPGFQLVSQNSWMYVV